MKQILGLDTGTVTFTPGGAGAGTIVFSSVVKFRAARLMAVTNVTRKELLYAAEVAGKGGTWSSVTSTGGTLTLESDTTGYSSGDDLRCIYEGDDVLVQGEDNRINIDLPAWTTTANTTRTNDFGDGPLPGTRSTRFVMASPSFEFGVQNDVFVRGRMDCARLSFSIYAKGSGQVIVGLYCRTDDSVVKTNAKQITYTLTSNWTLLTVEHINPYFNTSTVRVFVCALNSSTVTCELACPGLWEGLPTGKIPRWTKPVPLTDRGFEARPYQAQSVVMWGDSLTNQSNKYMPRWTNGGYVYNGGVDGETSTQILSRVTSNSDLNHQGVVIFWAGRNNRTSPSTVLSDIDSMTALVPHGKFLVISVTNDTTETIGSSGYNNVATINARLAAKYGSRFVDVRSALCIGNANDVPNSGWMADTIHPNIHGYGVVYQEIYKAMLSNGYLPWLTPFDQPLSRKVISWAFTRPADTNVYASGDLVANSTVAGNVVVPAFPINKPSVVRRIRLHKSGTSTTSASFRVHLFGDVPTVSAGDNGALGASGASSYLGQWDITIAQAWSDGATGFVDVNTMTGCGWTTSVYAIIEARAAYTPGNAEVFRIILEVDPA